MTGEGHYDRATLAQGLRAVGLVEGDLAFSHVGVGMLGFAREGRSERAAWDAVVSAFTEVLGATGTWLVPTYSYTYTKPGAVYDPAATPSDVGAFTEHFRGLPGAQRSLDPLFSVAAIGPRAAELLDGLPPDCFGPDSIYGRLTRAGGKLCNVGVGFRYATYVHHVEQLLAVPYRYPKYFSGVTRCNGVERPETWKYNVRDLEDPAGLADLRRLEQVARSRDVVRAARVGRGEVTCVGLADLFELCRGCVAEDPWFMARGGAADWQGRPRRDQTGRVERSPA